MKQMSFADAEYADKYKQTRPERFLIEMNQVVPWKGLIALTEPYYPKGEGDRPAYPLMAMLRVHLMQKTGSAIATRRWKSPSTKPRFCASLPGCIWIGFRMKPRSSTSAGCWKQHELAGRILQVISGYLDDRGLLRRQGTVVDATIVHAPSSTKNRDGKRDPEMRQTKKGNQ